jgi:YggT family protein
MGYFANAGVLLVQTIFGLLLFILTLRFLLQLIRANFHNPICQGIYKLTTPVVMPVQKVIPNWRQVNLASAAISWFIAVLWMAALGALMNAQSGLVNLIILGLAQWIEFVLNLLFWITLIRVLLSWFSPDTRNPAIPLLYGIADLTLKPIGRIIPPLGGIDLSPIIALLVLQLAMILIVGPLRQLGSGLAL